MGKTACRISLVLLAALLAADAALACTCARTPPPQEAKNFMDAVFLGTVLDVARDVDGRQAVVRLKVEKVWKGAKCAEATVVTGVGGGDCGYAFEAGKRYLVYASSDEGKLRTSLCTRTRPAAQAEEDLAALGAAADPCPALGSPSSTLP
jgi:hypothetical protein